MWRALIVEDNLASRKLLVNGLSGKAVCDEAIDGNRAMECYENSIDNNRPYDFIILDISMPQVDGGLVLEKIRQRERNRGTPPALRNLIFMVTVHDTMQKKAFYVGCDGYFTKPVEVGDVIKAIERKMASQKWVRDFLAAVKGINDIGRIAEEAAKSVKNRGGFGNVSLNIYQSDADIDALEMRGRKDFVALMSKRVIRDEVDTKISFFTEHGAFWCPSLNKFMQSHLPAKDLEEHLKSEHASVKTLALFPVRGLDRTIGLLEITDSREDRIDEEAAREYELFALSIAPFLKK